LIKGRDYLGNGRKYTFGKISIAILKSVGYIGLWLAISYIISVLVAVALNMFYSDSSVEAIQALDNQKSGEISIIANAVTVMLYALFYKLKKIPFTERCRINDCRIGTYLKALGLGVAAQLAIQHLLSSIMSFLPQSWIDSLNENNEAIINSPKAIMIITTVIMAPLLEEIMCRALMLGALKSAMPKWVAIIVSSLTFGLLHGNPIGIIYASLLGILLGWIFIKTDSVLPAIFCHLSFNLTSYILGEMEGISGTVILASVPLLIILIKSMARETE
jgi:membrane protease YdiL (CAAX protease family)